MKGSCRAGLSSGRTRAFPAYAAKRVRTTSPAALKLSRSAGRSPRCHRDGGHHGADEGGAEQPQRPPSRQVADGQISSKVVEGVPRLPVLLATGRNLPILVTGYPLPHPDTPFCALKRELVTLSQARMTRSDESAMNPDRARDEQFGPFRLRSSRDARSPGGWIRPPCRGSCPPRYRPLAQMG